MGEAEAVFREFSDSLGGLAVSRFWRGHGGALFIEFGELEPGGRSRRDGNPEGEFGLMIETDWRLENASSIICGSASDDDLKQIALESLLGLEVRGASLSGRLPEIAIELTNSVWVTSLTTSEGDPEWTLTDQRKPHLHRWLSVKAGRLRVETSVTAKSGSNV